MESSTLIRVMKSIDAQAESPYAHALAKVRDLVARIDNELALIALALDTEPQPSGGGTAMLARLASAPERVGMSIAPGATFFRIAELPAVDLRRRRPARKILESLARAHIETPGQAVSSDALVAAGWPGEAMHPTSAKNRLYVAILVLRNSGLRGILLAQDGGYLLAPWIDLSVG